MPIHQEGRPIHYDRNKLLVWLLKADPAIVYQTHRDLLKAKAGPLNRLRKRIAKQGWGKAFLSRRDNKTGMWGNGIYSPKWISTTYTLLDLKHLGIGPETREYAESCEILIDRLWKIPETKKERHQDLCICGMILDVCCYAGIKSAKIDEIVDYILDRRFRDGGWNCRWEFDHKHGSLHTTINVLEGLREYLDNGYSFKKKSVISAVKAAHEFILTHRLFKSDKTGRTIDKRMTMLSYPFRWKHDILRCMDYFRSAGREYDPRMKDALEIIADKRLKNHRWPVQQKYSGLVHFDMEKTGKESRWNTLRALRVLKKYGRKEFARALAREP